MTGPIKTISAILFATLVLALSPLNSQAEKICKKSRGKNLVAVSSTASCPRRYTQLFDTSILVEPPVLSSGRSLTGAIVLGFAAPAGGLSGSLLVQFSPALPSSLPIEVLAPGDPATASCPGSVSNPQAVAGQVCVYMSLVANISSTQFFTVPGLQVSFADKYGFGMEAISAAGGPVAVIGAWAVTAP